VERREAEKITLRSKLGFEVENIDEITHLQADSNYTHVHFLEKKSITVPYTLKRFEEVLSQEKFIRVHHSYLVNLAHILSFDSQNNLLLLKGDIEVSVSRRKKQMLKDLLRF
ncbi:MAG: LytTR family DNA-binding domain-containing protein, partial [Bacteroidota bacterium]